MAFFGLKLGLDLAIRAAHPHQKFQRVPPPPRAITVHNQIQWRDHITVKIL